MTFFENLIAWLTAQWEKSAWFDQSEHHPKMTFFENLVDGAMGKVNRGSKIFFLRAATDDNIRWSSLMSNIVNKVLNLKNFGSTFLSFLPLYMSHQGRGWYGNHQIDIMLDASETNLCVQRNNVAKFKVCVTRIFLDAKVLQKSCRGALNGAEW